MRKIVNINNNWSFSKCSCSIQDVPALEMEKINLPHTWNNIDGQDGGMDEGNILCVIRMEEL